VLGLLGLGGGGGARDDRRDRGGRGRDARRPADIPARGWRDVLARTWREQSADNMSVLAAGVAYYMLFSLFPAMTALVSLYGLFNDPATVEAQIRSVAGILPEQASELVLQQLASVASAPSGGLGAGLAISVGVALWSASFAVQTMITALNIAYDETERRSMPRFYAVSLGLTLAAILFVPVALGLVAVLPAVLSAFRLGGTAETLATWLRWPVLAVLVMLALAALYRFAPCRATPRWRWVSWGAVVATLVWIAASVGFSIYVRSFADYNATYGSLGGVVVLLFWFYITAYVVLLGAELNAEIEHQTARDSTTGPDRPIGRRDAYVADTVGAPAGE